MRITDLSLSDGEGELCVHVSLGNESGEEEKVFPILCDFWSDFQISVADIPCDIDEETLDALEETSVLSYAVKRAFRMVMASPSSERHLVMKLRQKGFDEQVSRDAARYVSQRGYIDEKKIALREAELCVGKYWGRGRIIMKLHRNGFSASAIEKVEEYLSELDFSERCFLCIMKKYKELPSDESEKRKMYSALSRLGYTCGEIKTALRRFGR